MHFKSSLIGLAAIAKLATPTAAASTLAPRDLTAMVETFDKIFTGIENLVSSVQKFSGSASEIPSIISTSARVEKEILDGAARVEKSPMIPLLDMLNLFGPIFVMESQVGEVVDELSKKKALFEKVGAGPQIRDALMKERKATGLLVEAIKKNLPLQAVIGPIAGPLASIITDRLDQGILEWGGSLSVMKVSQSGSIGNVPKIQGGDVSRVAAAQLMETILLALKTESEK